MHAELPNGFFSHGLLVYGDLTSKAGGYIAKGFRITPPDLNGASVSVKLAIENRLRAFQQMLSLDQRVQFQWRVTSDYRKELKAYDAVTKQATNPVSIEKRNARSKYFWKKLNARKLRREECMLFISSRVKSSPPRIAGQKTLARHFELILQQQQQAYEQVLDSLGQIFGEDVIVEATDDRDNFLTLYRFFNPSQVENPNVPYDDIFNPECSIQENCLTSSINGGKHGFYLDGNYNQILTLKRLGRGSQMGMIQYITSLPFLNYQITVNLEPVNIQAEIRREEREREKLEKEQLEKFSVTKEVAIQQKLEKTKKLAEGSTTACWTTLVVRVWAPNEIQLAAHVSTLKNAFANMYGTQVMEENIPAAALRIFYSTTPGWCWSSYKFRNAYYEDTTVAHILPFSSTFTGNLDEAEALYEGSNGNLVGMASFAKGRIPTPQLAMLIGMSGSGKSHHVGDFLYQSDPYFGYTAIIDDGRSHEHYAKAHNVPTLFIQPDSKYTINYLSTAGLPISQSHLAMASALATHMGGHSSDAREHERRKAMLTQYITELNSNCYESWIRRNLEKLPEIQREAFAIDQWHKTRMGSSDTLLDAFVAIKNGIKSGNAEILEFIHSFPEEDIIKFSKEPRTAQRIAAHAFSFFEQEEYPTHASLVELMLVSPMENHERREVMELGTMLKNWTEIYGQYGRLFDGPTNVDLTAEVVHIELSGIPDSMPELKSAAALLITGYIRQHIVTLPRQVFKRCIYEELIKLIRTIPDAAKLIEENYGQLRKYNAWVLTIMQQFGTLKDTDLAPIIIGNSKQYFIMRQNDATDVAGFSERLATPIPQSMQKSIMKYPLIEHQKQGNPYSSLCLFNPSSVPPICGTMRNYEPPTDEN